MSNNNYYKVQLVIDNDKSKDGELFEGKVPISHPENIRNWADYYIIITVNNNIDSIRNQLENLELKYQENFIIWNDLFKILMY